MADADWMKAVVLIVALGAVLGGVAVALNGRLTFQGIPPADNGAVRLANDGKDTCDDFGTRGLGAFPSPPGKSLGGIFRNYVTWFSFLKDGRSQPVFGQAAFATCSTVWSPASESFYVFEINNGKGFQGFYTTDTPNGRLTFAENGGTWVGTGRYNLNAFAFQISGFRFCTKPIPAEGGCPSETDIVDGAVLRVKVGYDFPLLLSGECCDPDKYLVRDELTLRNGYASVGWDEDGYDVNADAKATFTWKAPTATYQDCDAAGTCTERPAYVISVFDDNTGLALEGWDRTPIPTATGRGEVDLSADLFSNDMETCRNTLTVVIYTEIAEIAQDWAGLSDSAQVGYPAGEVTDVELSPTEIRQGDVVTVTWSFTGNATGFVVRVEINGKLVLDELNVPPDQRSVNFTASFAGQGHAGVAAKNYCQVGEFKKTYFSVGPVYYGLCNLFPELPQCASANNVWAFLWAALAVLAIIVVFGLVLWVGARLEAPPFVSFTIALLLAGGVAVGLVLVGAFDGVMGLAGLVWPVPRLHVKSRWYAWRS